MGMPFRMILITPRREIHHAVIQHIRHHSILYENGMLVIQFTLFEKITKHA